MTSFATYNYTEDEFRDKSLTPKNIIITLPFCKQLYLEQRQPRESNETQSQFQQKDGPSQKYSVKAGNT